MIEQESIYLEPNKASGWGKHAFVYGFRSLLAGHNYIEAIQHILRQGGDTDTNSCIIGALIAAADGSLSLPTEMVAKLLH